jgi:tetratricopeptide (TPR) repeat protein
MTRVEKTVFISYRRTNASWALAIFQDLTQHGYDVFFDFKGIASGDFETIILENIRARAHFLVVLTPSALERCSEPGDWLRREIEAALDSHRNIVPLMLENFDFNSPSIANQLTGKLAALKHYNGLRVPVDYFWDAMDRLRERYLDVPLDAVLHPASSFAMHAANDHQIAAKSTQAVQDRELVAQRWFEQAFESQTRGDLDGALRNYNEAINLKPDYAEAYRNRALVRSLKGDVDGAKGDSDEATRLEREGLEHLYQVFEKVQQQSDEFLRTLADLGNESSAKKDRC